MSRYIEVDHLKKSVEELPNCYNGFSDTYDKACIIGLIDEEPTADVVPVVHGHWIEQQTSNIYKCSVCGERIYSSREVGNLHAFCRYCGAKMDEVTE